MAIISHFNEVFTKGGQKRTKAVKISKEEVKCCQKVTSCGKIDELASSINIPQWHLIKEHSRRIGNKNKYNLQKQVKMQA